MDASVRYKETLSDVSLRRKKTLEPKKLRSRNLKRRLTVDLIRAKTLVLT